jgi:negative regulator of sigma E activity
MVNVNGKLTQMSKEIAYFLFPDYTRQGLDLRDEAKRARQYPTSVTGQEIIAGREAARLKIAPPGGDPYDLWIDAETNLPLQLQTAFQNSLRTTYTFVQFEPNIPIDPQLFAYQVPQGFKVIEDDPGQLVTTIQDAAAISGFVPVIPQTAPGRIFAFQSALFGLWRDDRDRNSGTGLI